MMKSKIAVLAAAFVLLTAPKASAAGEIALEGPALVVAVVNLAVLALAVVFCFFFLFRFRKLRNWFNTRAGADVVPAKRLDVKLLRLALFVFLLGVVPAMVKDTSLAPYGWYLEIPVLGAYLYWRYCRRRKVLGSRGAVWEMIYILFAGYSCALCVMVGIYAAVIWLVVKLVFSTDLFNVFHTDDTPSSSATLDNLGRPVDDFGSWVRTADGRGYDKMPGGFRKQGDPDAPITQRPGDEY